MLVMPLSFAIMGVVAHTEDVGEWAQTLRQVRVPPAPTWVEQVPGGGTAHCGRCWNDLRQDAAGAALSKNCSLTRGQRRAGSIAKVGSVGMPIVQFLLTRADCSDIFCSW